MVANTPGILPKAGLVGSKIINYPFTIPKKLADSSYAVGAAGAGVLGGTTGSLSKALTDLQPKGPAKWFVSFLDRISGAAANNQKIADRNMTAFWKPFGDGMAQVGQAFGGPGAYWYAKKAGIESPTADTIKAALKGSIFKFPTAEELGGAAAASAAEVVVAADAQGGGTPPAGEAPESAVQAAEGAGQLVA